MTGTVTTNMCSSAKVEFMQAAHNFSGTVTATASSSSSTSYTSVSSVVGLSVGMPFSGTNVGTNPVIAAITSATAFTSSVASAGTISGGTLTFTGDVFKVALINGAASFPVFTYDSTFANIGTPGSGTATVTNLGTDEWSGTGYTSGGQILASNTTPVLGGSAPQVAFTTWSVNPSWTTATITSLGCIIYNTAVRMGGAVSFGGGRALGVFSFGGVQSVVGGTFTILLPASASTTAILRIG